MGKPTFYHASPRRFRHGDLLVGGHEGGFGYAHDSVCMTDGVAPHATVASKAIAENWLVYEVKPVGPVGLCGGNNEFQARAAKVLRCVGRVSSFAHKPTKGARKDRWSGHFYSMVPEKPHRGVSSSIPARRIPYRGV